MRSPVRVAHHEDAKAGRQAFERFSRRARVVLDDEEGPIGPSPERHTPGECWIGTLRIGLTAAFATTGWCLSNLGAWWRYRRALDAPAAVQAGLLAEYVRRNRDTLFGRAHGFARIRSVADYQARVPLMRYEDCEPLITRVAHGEPGVLTAEPVTRLAITSGSSSAAKLIPYTARLQREYARAVGPWIVGMYGARPQLAGGPAYWSVTPQVPPLLVGGAVVPVGFDADARYLGGMAHRLVDAAMAVPAAVRGITEHETHRYVTILFLLRCAALRLISVWHPSYLALLLDAARTHWEDLLRDIRDGGVRPPGRMPAAVHRVLEPRLRSNRVRAAALARLHPGDVSRIWPAVGLISCWGDAAAQGAIEELRRRWPHVPLQPKGLLATECVVTLPFGACAPAGGAGQAAGRVEHQPRPLAVCSHVFEFLDESGRAWLAEQLEPGGIYEVVVTTGGGLYRYRLGDLVRVDGLVGRTPSLAFVGRGNQVSDAVGEKLHDTFVAGVIGRLFAGAAQPRFAMLAPERTAAGLSYTLFVETDGTLPPTLPGALEAALGENPHYKLAVALGQLAPSSVVRILDGYETFAGRLSAQGRRLGDVKPVALHPQSGWSAVFRTFPGGCYR